ncbi:lipopolysaccharide assembly protein LapB [uncultured Methanobrevibacter sp.]|uniref:tetratricopeptide repeat protein n=1 Tax=uncultured Methanobrevibacter sp. TaxID=253161 RepID=UPI0025CEF7F3|nr:hypothetical protein [uncultured Methanobrevibacter sp.]
MASIIDKYQMKDKGLTLERNEPEEAIKYYEELLNHKYFINDFWSYRRLVLMYKKTKEFDKKTDIIKRFFKSGIYCNMHQFLWFRNKLRSLCKKDYITSEEISSLEDYFKTHSIANRQKANTPLPIADRIKKRNSKIVVISEDEYENRQKQYEYEVRCTELNRQKRYREYIDLLNHMIDDLGYKRYSYFQKLCVAYRRLEDYDNELRIINKYMNGESARTKVSDEWFEKRLQNVEAIEKPKTGQLKKENKKSQKKACPIPLQFEDKTSYEIPFNMDEFDLATPPIYEYDSSLNEFENLKRKNILIQYGKLLIGNERIGDAIRHYRYLCNNTYFSNDWYPYRQLAIIYTRTKDYKSNLINIKRLLRSKTYLNRYQHIWFGEKIRQIMLKEEVDEYEIKRWFEYYQSHGALNEKKTNRFLADKFIEANKDTIIVLTDESFTRRQERYALEETGCIYERVGNYELARSHYKKIIEEKEFDSYKFYQRICYCSEKLKDYDCELKAIKAYYANHPGEANKDSDEWFEKRLRKVNAKLNTGYGADDFILD